MTNKTLIIILFYISQTALGQSDFARVVDYYGHQKNLNGTVLVATQGQIDYLSGVGISNRQSQLTINTKSYPSAQARPKDNDFSACLRA